MNGRMIHPIAFALLMLHLAPGLGLSDWHVFAPDTIMAGAWQVPLFLHTDQQVDGPVSAVIPLEGDTLRIRLRPLPSELGASRFVVFLDDPRIAYRPGAHVAIRLVCNGEEVAEHEVYIAAESNSPWILSVEETGEAILWQSDGGGGLLPTDTLESDGGVEEALLVRNEAGGVDITIIDHRGELAIFRKAGTLEEIHRISLGGLASALAPIPGSGDFLVGFLDGRIVRVTSGRETVETVATVSGIPTNIAVGDANADGTNDLVATILEMDRSLIAIWFGNGLGGYDSDRGSLIPLPGVGRAIEFTNDRDSSGEDLLLLLDGGRASLSGVMIWRTANADRRESATSIDLPGIESENVHRLYLGDWNADGKEDIGLVYGTSDPVVQLYVRDGETNQVAWSTDLVPLGGVEVGVVVSDIDGNGADDLIVAEGEFQIWLNDGTGRLVRHPVPADGNPARLYVERND